MTHSLALAHGGVDGSGSDVLRQVDVPRIEPGYQRIDNVTGIRKRRFVHQRFACSGTDPRHCENSFETHQR